MSNVAEVVLADRNLVTTSKCMASTESHTLVSRKGFFAIVGSSHVVPVAKAGVKQAPVREKGNARTDISKFKLVKFALIFALLLTPGFSGFAQQVSADSINKLNENNKMLQMAVTINNQKLQLAKLQNQLIEQNYKAEKTSKASQESASKNEDAATLLNLDDQNKNKATTARKSARTADRNSARARNAQNKTEDISDDIASLEKSLSDNIQELTMMGGLRYLQ